MSYYTYKYRLYPTKEQQKQLISDVRPKSNQGQLRMKYEISDIKIQE